MQSNIKKFIKENKELINAADWGKLILNAASKPDLLDQEDINIIIKYLSNIGVQFDSIKLFSGFSHSLTDINTMHEDFYKKFTLKNMHQFQGETINKFDFTAKNNYRFDFEDVPVEKNTIIGGSELAVITESEGNVEIYINLYNNLDHEALLGTYYFYDNELAKNIVVLNDFGIGYNKNKVEDCILNLLRSLK